MKNLEIDAFSVFGSGRVATSVTEALSVLEQKMPHFFVVTDPSTVPVQIAGYPVIGFEQYVDYVRSAAKPQTLLIALPKVSQEEVAARCRKAGIDYICISGHLENELLHDLYRAQGRFQTLDLERLETEKSKRADCHLYMAKSVYDQPLTNTYDLSSYILPIHAGAALTEQKIAALCDNQGENISEKNPYYCELTALYWMWKHAKEKYIGLCHYRRMFDLSDHQLEALLSKNPDAVLLYPSIQYPDAGKHEKRYLNEDMRCVIRDVLRMQSEQYCQDYEQVMKDKYIYNFNMFIARRDVFQDYCKWLFDTIRQMEELCRIRDIVIEKRQQGYWSEVLMSCYFLTNRKKLDIYHVGHKMLI